MTFEDFALVVYVLAYHCDQYASVQGGFEGYKEVSCPEVRGAVLRIHVNAVKEDCRVYVTIVRVEGEERKTICNKKSVDLETLLLVLLFGKLSGSPGEKGTAQMHIATFRAQYMVSHTQHQAA